MPPLALASLLNRALPWLSADGQAVLKSLICDNGRAGSAEALSHRLGLRSRFQLNRLLHREGLPTYEELAGWVSVFYWMLRADAGEGRGALRALAGQTPIETASSYRLVRRVTGRCWRELRRVGTTEVLRWFERRVRAPNGGRTISPEPRREPFKPPVPPATGWSATGPCRVITADSPHGVAVRGRDLAYITLGHSAGLAGLDLRNGRFVPSIPVGCMPSCVAFGPGGALAYVSLQFSDEIAVIDTARHRQIQTLRVSGDPFPIAVSRSGRTLFVTTNEDRLFGLSLPGGRVIGTVALPATSHHITVHPSSDRLYVATRAGGSVLEIDTNHYRVLRTFTIGGWPQGLAVSPDGATLYVANERQGLEVIRLASGKSVARLDAESGGVALALSPDHRFLYVAFVRAGRVGMIELSSLRRTGTIETGGRPGQIAFDGAGRVIITNEAGWLDILPVGGLRGVASLRDRSAPAPAPRAASL
jgi:YVTN family beta-propeller protein